MKPVAAMRLTSTGWLAAVAILAVSSMARADELNNLRANQDTIQSRIDELARPAPQSGEESSNPAAAAPSAGSFPRSFLVPGTDTSIRIGGSVDGTMGYYGH